MRISNLAPLFAVGAAALSTPFFGSGDGQARLSADPEVNPVPGDNPLMFCQDPTDYLLNITNVDIDPNPPLA